MKSLGIFLSLIGLTAFAHADPRNFVVNVRPIFESTSTWSNAPIAIEMENKGPDAKGRILVSGNGVTTRYPVELPTGSKKRVVVYAGSTQFGMLPEFLFDSDQGRFEIPYTSNTAYNYGNTYTIALISDNSGELGFLRQRDNDRNRSQTQALFTDAYCVPEDAPVRPVGFQGIAAVVLGNGSDRLSDQSVAALKSYALTGGSLVFVGGASAATLNDPRWRDVLPATGFQTKTISAAGFFRGLDDTVTVASGAPIPSAKVVRHQGVAMTAERALGIGRVVVLAYNPFEDPIVRWPGRQSVFLQVTRGGEFQRANQFLSEFGVLDSYEEYGYSSPPPIAVGSSARFYPANPPQRQDPFSVELPKASKVFWILAAFFVVVVPINFLVLRKLGKGEWAWVSAPVISLFFAGVFLNQASDLYAASLSTATNGVLLVQEGMPEGMFIGTTQIFFPNGGSYDLKLSNIDQLGTDSNDYNPYERRESRSQIDPIDNGTILVPDLRAANLAFEDIGYRQRIPEAPKIQVQSSPALGGQIRLTIKNLTQSSLNNAQIFVAGRSFGLNAVAPGGQLSMTVPSDPAKSDQSSSYLQSLSGRQQVVIVSSEISQIKPGPQLGNQVALRSRIRLVYVSPLQVTGEAK